MSEQNSNNSTIAKNTIFLYIRMLVLLLVSLYTSRVILASLGVLDFGIYSAVGGVVGMLSFLNASLAGATSRFLTYELGKGNFERLKETFKATITLHLYLIIILIVIFETIGLWFVNFKLNVPIERLSIVNIVFQLSVLACTLQILIIPFNAVIISHEHMNVFAFLGIFDAVLKLVVAFLVAYSPIDKLLNYASLLALIALLDVLIYIVYCKKNFYECSLSICKDKAMMKPILSFSGWDLFGNFSVVVRSQGLVIIQNMFFGPIINAATTVSNQVMTAVMGFAENFLTAIKPQIVKQYAQGTIERFNNLVYYSSKYCFLLLFTISFPIFVEADYILNLWLVDVPDYAVAFCRLSIINNWISIIYRPIVVAIGATGKVKRISLINGSVYLLVLPLSYVFLKCGGSPIVPFVLNILLLAIGHSVFSMHTIKLQIPQFSIRNFFKKSIFPSLIVFVFASVVPLFVAQLISDSMYRFITNFLLTILWSLICITTFALNHKERSRLKNLIKCRCNFFKR